MFLAVQWPYVFAAVARETDLTRFGVATYSEYVNRGFVELLFTALFLYGLIWIGLVSLRGKKEGEKSILPIVQCIVLVEFFIFLVSISRRILLYWQFHGLSLVRLYGGIFLIYLGILTVTLAARHFWKYRFVVLETAFGLGLILFIGFLNAEEFIVKNHPPTVNDKIDYVYLSRLSSDGYDGWIAAYHFAQNTVSRYTFIDSTNVNELTMRELAYTGTILAILTRNYHELTRWYATDSEYTSYTREVSRALSSSLIRFKDILSRDLVSLQRGGNDVHITLDGLLSSQGDANGRSTLITELLNGLQTTEKSLLELDTAMESRSGIRTLPTATLTNYQFGPCQFSSFEGQFMRACMPEFYAVERNVRKPQTAIDRLLVWNWQDREAYKRLRRDVPVSELLALQRRYIDIYYQLLQLPSDKRAVSWDISLDAPFVAPL